MLNLEKFHFFLFTPMNKTTEFPLTTTLGRIEEYGSGTFGHILNRKSREILKTLYPEGGTITFSNLLDHVGLGQTLMCCKVEPRYSKLWREYGLWCAKRVEHLTIGFTSIPARDLLKVVELNLRGEVTDEELKTVRDQFYLVGGSAMPKSVQAAQAVKYSANPAECTTHPCVAASFARKAAFMDVPDDGDVHLLNPDVESWGDSVPQTNAFLQLVTTGNLPKN